MKWTAVERPDDPRATRLAKRFEKSAKGWTRVSHDEVRSGDIILAVGGDGTAMAAMRLAASCGARIVAVHGGTLGFLSDHSPDEIHLLHESISKGDFSKDERFLLSYDDTHGNQHLAANEIVISDVSSGTPHDFSFDVGAHSSGRFAADALIVSTPTGSTAYAMSAGGAIIHPHSLTVSIAAVAPMALAFRPVCVPCTRELVFHISARKNSTVSIKADIHECERFDIRKGQTFSFKIRKASSSAVFLRRKGWDFFDTLSKKLGWAIVPGIGAS